MALDPMVPFSIVLDPMFLDPMALVPRAFGFAGIGAEGIRNYGFGLGVLGPDVLWPVAFGTFVEDLRL